MSDKLKTQRFTVRLTQNDVDQLSQIADREGFKPSAIVRHLIIRFLENRQSLGVFNAHVTR